MEYDPFSNLLYTMGPQRTHHTPKEAEQTMPATGRGGSGRATTHMWYVKPVAVIALAARYIGLFATPFSFSEKARIR